MDILNSKLAQNNGLLAKEIQVVLDDAEKLGASVGVQRMQFICDQYDKVSPDIAYHWIDLNAFQIEIEEAQAQRRGREVIHFFRNVFSLAPLILTWLALFFAVRAYQQDLALYRDDINIPFLQLWQTGFHGFAFITFTLVALADAALLSLYLISILVSHELDRRAQSTAANFIQKLRATTEKLMEVIADANITPIRAPEDIDKVTVAVTRVVDSATEAIKQQAITTEQSIQQLVQVVQKAIDDANTKTADLFNNKITPILTTFDSNTTAFKTDLGTFQTQLNDLAKHTQQLASDSAALVANAQSYITVGQTISTHMAALNTTEQGVMTQLSNITGGFTSAVNGMTTATTGMETATGKVAIAAQQLDSGIQVTVTKMTDSVDRATAFQSKLGTFQDQIDDLSIITRELANASKTMVTNAQSYVNVGQAINTQVAALDTTEQKVLMQLGTIAGNMTNAARDMSAATISLQHASGSVGQSAQGFYNAVQTTLKQTSDNIDRASKSLDQVERQLSVTVSGLHFVANQLASAGLTVGRNPSLLERLLFGRGSNRSRGAGGRNP